MSQDQENQSVQNADQSVSADQKPVVERTPEQLEQRVKEIAEEAKKARQTNAQLRAQLEAIETERLQEQGKWKEIAEKERARAEAIAKEAKAFQGKIAVKTIESQFISEAAKLGCVDTEALLKVADLNNLEVDPESYSVSQASLKSELEKLQKERGYFFQKSVTPVKDMAPHAKSSAQNISLNDELKNAKNQKEFDAILKKLGIG